jgi:hypothetical protein
VGNQEERPPLASITPCPLDPYLPPPCVQNPPPIHPHQYFLIELDGQQVWRPITEGESPSVVKFPTYEYLLSQPLIFPTVAPFKGYSPHSALVSPTNIWQATLFNIPPLYVCCHAGYAPPTVDIPFGYLVYTFRPSIRKTFLKHGHLVHNVFEGALVVSEVYDFLDGRRIYTYGKLRFHQDTVRITHQTLHFEDALSCYPFLFHHTLHPHRLPEDPCSFIHTYPNDCPL